MGLWLDFFRTNPAETGVFVFMFGLCIGSFLNVCIVRWPKNESVVKGRSHCPACRVTLPWYENIPVLSFLVLRGKCRHCKAKISFRYPLVELVTAGSFLALYLCYGVTAHFFFYAYFIASLIVATFADFECQIIPDEVSFTGILIALTASFFFPALHGEMDKRLALADSAGGMLGGVWLIWGIAMLGQVLFRKEAMGGGDLKLLAMIGAFIGFERTILTFFIAPLLALPVALVIKLKPSPADAVILPQGAKAGTEESMPAGAIAFGPYLAMGSLVSMAFGNKILIWIFGA